MLPDAQTVFDRTASTYDRERARLIPGYERFYPALTDLLPERLESCIDLGAGTGLLAQRVLECRPGVRLLLVDSSEAMLAQARKRLAGYPGVEFQCADYTSAELPGHQDAVISALSIHHLDHAAQRALQTRIAGWLRPGGIFLNADQVLGPTPGLEACYRADWLRRVSEAGAAEQQIAESLYRQQADRCATVEQQMAWMREALHEVDCWYKDGRFAVMHGMKEG